MQPRSFEQRAGWVVGLVLLLVYAACISPHWKVGRDSALYLSVARSLAEGHGYAMAGIPCYGLPFGLPVMLAGIYRVAGANYLLMNTVMAAFALITLWFVYRSVSEIAGCRWGLLVVTLTGLSYRMVQFAGQIMTDMPAMCCLWIGFYYLQRLILQPQSAERHAFAGGVALTAGCAFRLSKLFSFPVAVLAAWLGPAASGHSAVRRLLRATCVLLPAIALAVIGMLIFRSSPQSDHPPMKYLPPASWEENLAVASLFGQKLLGFLDATLESVTTQDTGVKQLLESGGVNTGRLVLAGVLIPVLTALLAAGAWRLRRKDRGLGLWMFVSYVAGMCLVAPMPTPRYVLPVLPWVIWFLAEGLEAAWQRLKSKAASVASQGPLPVSLPVGILLAVCLLPNLLKIGREVKLAHARDYYAVYQRGHWKPYLEVGEWIRAHAPAEARLVTQERSIFAWLTNRLPLLYPPWAKAGDLLVLEARGQQSPTEARTEFDKLAWALVASGRAEAVCRCDPLVVYRMLPAPATAP
ncbi:MAG: hypothetical protein N2689_11100 [Verrucomicrobiae bacterium]|nr:hypothetical protein [Verrucomicrobiae bacterium]